MLRIKRALSSSCSSAIWRPSLPSPGGVVQIQPPRAGEPGALAHVRQHGHALLQVGAALIRRHPCHGAREPVLQVDHQVPVAVERGRRLALEAGWRAAPAALEPVQLAIVTRHEIVRREGREAIGLGADAHRTAVPRAGVLDLRTGLQWPGRCSRREAAALGQHLPPKGLGGLTAQPLDADARVHAGGGLLHE